VYLWPKAPACLHPWRLDMDLMTVGIIILAVIVIGGAAKSAEKVMLMQYVSAHETDPAARMLKMQMITNLDQVQDAVVRGQLVNQILK
jgi:hypothetical protein